MVFGIPELISFKALYQQYGVDHYCSRFNGLAIQPEYSRLGQALQEIFHHLDTIVRLGLDRGASDDLAADDPDLGLESDDFSQKDREQFNRSVKNIFCAYQELITELNKVSEETILQDEVLAATINSVTNILRYGLELHLTDQELSGIDQDSMQSLHRMVVRDFYPSQVILPPGLTWGEAYEGLNDSLDEGFYQDYEEALKAYCRDEWFPQILDQGFDLPDHITINLDRRVYEEMAYKRGSPSKRLSKDAQEELTRQFVDKAYTIALDLLQDYHIELDGEEAVVNNLVNLKFIASSKNYIATCSKTAREIMQVRSEFDLNDFNKRVYVPKLKLDTDEYFVYEHLCTLFSSIEAEIDNYLEDLESGIPKENEHSLCSQHIQRGIALVNNILAKQEGFSDEFKPVITMAKSLNSDISSFAEQCFKLRDPGKVKEANEIFAQYARYIDDQSIVTMDGYNASSVKKQLKAMAVNPPINLEDLSSNFVAIFAQAISMIMKQMQVCIDPADLVHLESLTANLEVDTDEIGCCTPRIVLNCCFDDVNVARRYNQNYRPYINEMIEHSREGFVSTVDKLYYLDWSKLEKGTRMPINIGYSLGNFSLAS